MNKLKLLMVTGVILIMQIIFLTAAFAKPVMKDLGTLGGNNTTVVAMNDKGQVIGHSDTANGKEHGFVWEDGKITDLGTLGGYYSRALAINNKGQIIGYSTLANGAIHGFIWENGKMKDLGTLGGDSSFPIGINEKGQVVGSSGYASLKHHAFIWENGKMTDLGSLGGDSAAEAINEKGQVVGEFDIGNGEYHAFIWEDGKMTDLGLGGKWSGVYTINKSGQVLGFSSLANGEGHVLIWENGKVTDIGNFGAGFTAAGDMNDKGQVVGLSGVDVNSSRHHAFLWDNGKMIDIGSLGGRCWNADAINEKGQVVGDSDLPDGTYHAFLWENGSTKDLGTLGGNSDPKAINEKGQVVGNFYLSDDIHHGFIWSDDTIFTPALIHVNTNCVADVSTNVGGNTLISIMNGNGTLIPNVDYKVLGSVITINGEYIKYYFTKFPNQNLYLHFNFVSGDNSVLTIYAGDTPHVVITDGLVYKLGSGDARLNLVPNGNFIASIKKGGSSLIPRVDYTYEPSTHTLYIRRGYLNSYFSKTTEPLGLTVNFTGDGPKTVVINLAE